MMRHIWIVCTLCTLSGCTHRYFTEIGVGDNSGNWNDCGHTGTYVGLGAVGPITEDIEWELTYEHHSQWSCGFLVNDKEGESFLNHWGGKIRVYYF